MKTHLLAAASLLLATVPLHAQQVHGTLTVAVPYADLDLTNPRDRSALDRRLRDAARSVCRAFSVPGPLNWISHARCQRATVAEARQAAAAAVAAAETRARLAEARVR